MCIDIVEIWFVIADGQISSIWTELSDQDMIMVGYYRFTFLFDVCLQQSPTSVQSFSNTVSDFYSTELFM